MFVDASMQHCVSEWQYFSLWLSFLAPPPLPLAFSLQASLSTDSVCVCSSVHFISNLWSLVLSHFWLIAVSPPALIVPRSTLMEVVFCFFLKRGVYSELFLTTSCSHQNCSVAHDDLYVSHIGKVSICCLRQKHLKASLCYSLALWWWAKACMCLSLSSVAEGVDLLFNEPFLIFFFYKHARSAAIPPHNFPP